MANKFCPNLNDPTARALVNKLGLVGFYKEYIKNGYEIPNIDFSTYNSSELSNIKDVFDKVLNFKQGYGQSSLVIKKLKKFVDKNSNLYNTLSMLEKIDVEVHLSPEFTQEGFETTYAYISSDSESNVMFMSKEQINNSSVPYFVHVFVHELLHAYTVEAYHTNDNFRNKIDSLFTEAYVLSNNHDLYGWTNGKEFISEIYSNPTFQNHIKSLDTIWNKFLNILRNLFGLEISTKGNQIFDETFLLITDIIEQTNTAIKENRLSEFRQNLNTLNIQDFSDINRSESIQDRLFINKDLFDAKQQDSIRDSIIFQIQKYRDFDSNLSTESIKNNIINDLKDDAELFSNDNSEEAQELSRNINNVVEHFDRFWNAAEEKLESFGVKRVSLTPIQQDNDTNIEDSAYESSDGVYQKLNYSDESTFAQSSKDTASAHMKTLLSLIPRYEYEDGKIVKDEDGNYVEDLNMIGLPTFEDLDAVWNDMLYTLVDVPIGEKLNYLRDSNNPKHNIIYEHIVSDPRTQVQNEFEVVFSKQQAKFITVLVRRPDNSGLRTISIIDTNRSQPEDMIVADWYNNFLSSKLVNSDINGNLVVNTENGKKIRDIYNKALSEWDIPMLSKVFKNIGISLSQEALNSDGIYVNRSLVTPKDLLKENGKFIFNRLAGDIDSTNETQLDEDNSLEANNPFLTESRPIDLLAKLENKVNPSIFESSFISGDNKAKYSFVNNTYATQQFRKLTTDRGYLNRLKSTAYASESLWLNQLINNPTFKHWFDFKYVDTLGNDSNNQTNKPFRDMNTKEKEFFRVSLFQNGGQQISKDKNSQFVSYFVGLTPSDKTTLPIFRVPIVNTVSNQDTIDALYDQFISEYNRVKQTISQNSNENIIPLAQYHGKNGMGSKFIMFPMFNKILFQDKTLLELDDTRINDLVRPELEKFINQLTEDQINYWTSLGIYNKDIFDKSYKYKKGYTNDKINESLRELATNYSVNYFIALMNQTQLFSGDPALHGKSVTTDGGEWIEGSSIAKTWNNYFKRMAKDIAPGLDPNFEDDNFNTIFLKDLKYKSKHLSEYRKIIGEKADDSYGKINPADAQEYTTLDEHLNVLKALGRLSNEVEEAIQRLKDGSNNINDIQLVLQPMKPVYVDGVVEDGINKMYYIKTSSFPLVPALTRGLEIDKLRQLMEDNNIQRAVYESGVKLGLQGQILNVSDNGGTTFNTLSIDSKQIINLPRTGFRIQQEIPFHGEDDTINEGSQARKLILNNLLDSDIINYNNKEITGREAKEIYENLHIEKMNRAFDKLKEDIGVNEDGQITNLNNLAELLKQEATARNYPLNDIYSIEVIEENGIQKFKVPLAFTQNAQRFESILNSLVTNRVIKSELPGFSKVQGAGTGFTKIISDEVLDQVQSEILWINPNDTELNYIREENGKLAAADILVPNYLRDNDGNMIDISKYVVGGYLDMNAIPESVLTLIGLRIPTQGYNSMMKFKVKGFLPRYMGDLAIVPAEITAQMGSDFDVDKMFIYNYHHRVDRNGNIKKIETDFEIVNKTNQLTRDKVNEIYREQFQNYTGPRAEEMELLSSYTYSPDIDEKFIRHSLEQIARGTDSSIQDTEVLNPELAHDRKQAAASILKKLSYGELNLGTTAKADIDYSKLSKKQLDNLIIQMFEDRLSDPNIFADILEPNGFGKLPDIAKEVSKLTDSGDGIHTLTSKTQNNIYNINADGKMGTALFSLASTFYKAAQDAKLSINTPLKFKKESGEVVELNNLFEINNIEGDKRSNVIMYLQSAAVDNAKEQILGSLNINDQTMNVASVMAMIGLSEDFIGYFMAQPIIREYVATMQNSTDIIDGGSFDPDLSNRVISDLSSRLSQGLLNDRQINLFSSLDLRNQLLEQTNDGQLDIINTFYTLKNIADEVQVLQSVINPDTKGIGSSWAALEAKYIQIAKTETAIIDNKESILDNVGRSNLLFGKTSISKSIAVLQQSRNMFNDINIYTGPVYGEIIEPLLNSVDLSASETNIKDIYNNIKSYILSSGDFINSDDVNLIRDSLLYGKENIAERWQEYSNTPEGRRNILTKRIKAKLQTSKTMEIITEDGVQAHSVLDPNSFNGLTANNTPASSNSADINNATMYFYDMINSSNQTERKLAEDMVRYFILTGAQFGPNSIGKYITYDVLEKYNFSNKLREVENKLKSGNVDILDSFTDQYFQNNPFKAKSVELKDWPTNLTLNRLSTLNKSGDVSKYIVSYDSKTRQPKLYKYIGLDPNDNIVYKNIRVLGNKQLKKYNFNAEPLFIPQNQKNKEDVPVTEKEAITTATRGELISNKYNFNDGLNSILTRISEVSQVPEYKDLATKLINNHKISDLKLTTSTDLSSNGSYTQSTKTIAINLDKIGTFSNYYDKFEQVFLEELIHGLTVNKLTTDNSELFAPEITAKNKINRLYNEYINNFVDIEQLERFRAIYNTPAEQRSDEDKAFARAHLNDLYPLINVAEFVGQGLTKPEFRDILKGNNFWTRLVDLIKNLLGLNVQSDLDFLFSSTLDLIQDNEGLDPSQYHTREGYSIQSITNTQVGQTVTLFTDENVPITLTRISDNIFEGYEITKKQETELINSSEAATTSMEDLIIEHGTKVRYSLDELVDKYLDKINNRFKNIDESDLNEFNIDEYNRLQFVAQRDKFFENWHVKDYFNNQFKPYPADAQERFLTANGRPGYDRLKIWFFNNQLRVTRIDPPLDIQDTSFNIDEEVIPKSKEDKWIDRILKKYSNTVKQLKDRLKLTTDEGARHKLILQIEATEARLLELKTDRSIIKIVDSVERRLNLIEKVLDSDTPNYHELSDSFDYLKEFILINQEIDFDTGTDLGKRYSDKADVIAGQAAKMLTRLKDKSATLVQDWTNNAVDWSIAPKIREILEHGIKDVRSLEAGNLDFSQSSSEHIQALGYLMEAAQSKANDEHNEFMQNLLQVEAEYHAKYGSDYTQLYQLDQNGKPTKYLLNKYSDEFYKKTTKNFKFWKENVTIEYTKDGKEEYERARKSVKESALSDQEYLDWLRDNDPEQYIQDFNSGNKFDWNRSAKQYLSIHPTQKWIDSRYTSLFEKGEDDPAVKFYNLVEPLFRFLNRKYKSGQINYIPELQKDTIKYFMEGNLKGGISKVWDDFAGDIKNDVYISQDTSGDLDPLTREPRLRIPVRFFANNLETINRSTDLARIAEIVSYQEVSNKAKHEIEPILKMYYGLLKDAKQNKGYEDDGTPILIDKSADKLTEQAQFMINGWLYGLYRSTEDSEQKYGKYTDAVINYIRLKGMGYNPFSAIGNVMQGLMSNITFANGSQYFGQTDYFKAWGTMMHSIAGKTELANKISKAFIFTDAFVRHNEMNFGMSRELRTARKKFSNLGNAFILQQMGEYFVQGQTMVAIMNKEKVTDLQGNKRSLWEAFDNNFNWKTEEFGENPYKDTKVKNKLQAKIRKAIIDVHGNYARPIQNKKHFYFRLLYTFRTWLPQAITNRFGKEQTDILLGTTTKGRYTSIPAMWKDESGKLDWSALKDNILWLVKLGSTNNLSDTDKINMKKNLSELILLSTITATLLLLKSGFDDWDEEEKEIYTYLYNNLTRAQNDLLFFMNPAAMDAVLKDPIPAMSAVRDLMDITGASWDTLMGDPVYKSGHRKGQLRITKETIDIIPFVNQIPKNISYMENVFERR